MKPRALILCTALIIALPVQLNAQSAVTEQVWADYHLHYFTGEQQEFWGDLGGRRDINGALWKQLNTGLSMSFHRRAKTDAYVGLRFFLNYYGSSDDLLEIRPWQGAKVRWPLVWFFTFTNYFRVEERITYDGEDWQLTLRLRYRLSTRYPLRQGSLDKLYIPLAAEFFTDAGPDAETFFRSKMRFYIGLGVNYNDSIVGEFNFIVQTSESGETATLQTDDYIFRVSIKHLLWNRDYRRSNKDLPEN